MGIVLGYGNTQSGYGNLRFTGGILKSAKSHFSVVHKGVVGAILATGMLFFSAVSIAATPTYVGSFNVFDGQFWDEAPGVLSARQAAASLFGGSYSDYAISVFDSRDPLTISHSAWLDGFFDPQYLLTPAGEDFVGVSTTGKYDEYGAYSALVCDHANCVGWDNPVNARSESEPSYSYTNYVWRVTAVPEPSSMAMLFAGIPLIAFAWARRRQV